ncbi:glycosyltransferase [Synechococcus elongatus]|uniref:glycosyltransferase n=1 Tax=Synechococcus elongatus TaxID=32046 RepID=UPI000F7F1C99|nr:glycosyltransferase [Synechococcus elongatus]
MRIVILTIGTRGDVQPFMALGLGLKAAGYEVAIATQANYQSMVEGLGLEFRLLAGDPQGVQQQSGAYSKETVAAAAQLLGQILKDSWAACQDADAIVASPNARGATHIAEALNIPCFLGSPTPYGFTQAFPSPWFPPNFKLGGGWGNWLSHYAVDKLLWVATRKTVNQWRISDLGLKPLSWSSPYKQLVRRGQVFLHPLSEVTLPKPADWPEQAHLTGYWLLPEAEAALSPELEAFLEAGEPPVFIGFGSMVDQEPERLTAIAVEGLQKSGQRGILLAGWSRIDRSQLPDTVFPLESAPFGLLFPRLAAAVHHGGCGTTAASLQAGLPTIITAYGNDQAFWGKRVAELGAGPSPITREGLTAETLATAIAQTVNDPQMRSRAQAIGERLRAENGVAKAVKLLGDYLAAGTSS